MRALLLIIVCTALSIGGTLLFTGSKAGIATKETAYERVMRTGTIRCGYALWPPTAISKDAKTGKMEGIFVQVIEQMAANMKLKVEWTEETGWGSFIESLQSDRFDAFCAPLWRNAERGRFIRYTTPLAYSAVNFYARAGDTRFDQDLNKLNHPSIKLATMDGEMSQIIARNRFPKAQEVGIPQLGDISQLLLSVSTGKADGAFLEESLARDFSAKNPRQIRRVTATPFQVFPIGFGVNLKEEALATMFDSALLEMLNRGDIDRLIEQYEPDRSVFMPVAKPYLYIKPKDLP